MRPAADAPIGDVRPTQADRVLNLVRLFHAPRVLVWKAFTDPLMLARWWGPRGFTATGIRWDPRPGAAWRACLRRDDTGEEKWHSGVFREVTAPQRLVYTFGWDRPDGSRGPETLVTIAFVEEGNMTRMAFRQAVFDTAANRDGHRAGWTSTFDRLADFLATQA